MEKNFQGLSALDNLWTKDHRKFLEMLKFVLKTRTNVIIMTYEISYLCSTNNVQVLFLQKEKSSIRNLSNNIGNNF